MLHSLERPSQPPDFTVTSENATSLHLSWNKPENFDEEMDYYIVSYVASILCYTGFSAV